MKDKIVLNGKGSGQQASELAQLVAAARRKPTSGEKPYHVILSRVRETIVERFTPAELSRPNEQVRRVIVEFTHALIQDYYDSAPIQGLMPLDEDAEVIVQRVLRDILGFGPLDPYLRDSSIEEIIVNGRELWLIDEKGKRRVEGVDLGTEEEIIALVNRLVAASGRQVNTSYPILDAQLPDGNRINATIAPIASPSPAVTIRRHRLIARTMDDLIHLGTLNAQATEFLTAAVQARLGILVAGGTASGKTNLINVLAGAFPPNERVVVIEDTRELQLPLPDVIYQVVRYPNVEGKGEINQQRLVQNALRLRGDRIIVGEVRGPEVIDMLLAANTGHEGFLSSVHANSSTEALSKLIQLAHLAQDITLSEKTVAQWIAGAFQLVVFLKRQYDTNHRLVMEIAELTGGVESGNRILHQPIFMRVDDELRRSPYQLTCSPRFKERGIDPARFQPSAVKGTS